MLTTNETRARLEALLQAAVLAPSGDNTQPWKFTLDFEARQIVIRLVESRDPSPMNAGQRMSRVAIGAAAENVLRTCRYNQLDAEFDCDDASCQIRLAGEQSGELKIEADPVIAERVTNRRPYDGRSIGVDVVSVLQQGVKSSHAVSAHWITDATERAELGKLIFRADALFFGNRVLREAFLKNVRFDRPVEEAVDSGLSLGSLELSAKDLRAFRALPKLPAWLLKVVQIGPTFAKGNKKLVDSASGFCLGTASDDKPLTDIHVGQMMERAWLALTEQGLAVQPMMSLLVLENVFTHGEESLVRAIGRKALESLRDDFQRFGSRFGKGRPAFLLRFGYASPPTGRCGRLAAEITEKG